MDIKQVRDRAVSWIKKYKYAVLVLFVGILFMLLPGKNDTAEEAESPQPTASSLQAMDLTQELESILSSMEGVGKVKIMLSIAAGERTEYVTDETVTTSENGSTVKKETVIITDSNRTEQAVILQIIPQVYLGAIVICEGADQPSVKLAVVEAVSKITGLGSDKISVLKMK